jgi:ribosomal protein S18 acetylase RimI-like enzyme
MAKRKPTAKKEEEVKKINKEKIVIKNMAKKHVAGAVNIEELSATYPLTAEDFIRNMAMPLTIPKIIMVEDAVIGHYIYSLGPKRFDILHINIKPDWRRKGVGTHVIDSLKSKLNRSKQPELWVEVWDALLEVQLFFSKNDFVAEKVLKEAHEHNGDDKYRMIFRI